MGLPCVKQLKFCCLTSAQHNSARKLGNSCSFTINYVELVSKEFEFIKLKSFLGQCTVQFSSVQFSSVMPSMIKVFNPVQ